MKSYLSLSTPELKKELAMLQTEYQGYLEQKLSLNMARGRPNAEQLAFSEPLLGGEVFGGDYSAEGFPDVRNYGGVDGLPEMKAIFADILGVKPSEVIVGGNSSLNMMYDTIVQDLLMGTGDGEPAWSAQGKIKFLCPSPGYDRHFAICEQLGIEMIPVKMLDDGPDMDTVEKIAASDPSVKGIWCVPKYSNPDGITYSDETVRRFASLKTAAADFRIFWDNAYCIHDLFGEGDHLLSLMDECRKNGTEDKVYMFASTSKITYAGAGVAAVAMSEKNAALYRKRLSCQTIGPDKINELRHIRFFKNADGMRKHMALHAAVIRPRFEAVLNGFEKALAPLGICRWTKPNGGYFISFYGMNGTAQRIYALCKKAGVILTDAGAAYPYGKDPDDSNIRIAPTCPSLPDLRTAVDVFCVCVRMASLERLIAEKEDELSTENIPA